MRNVQQYFKRRSAVLILILSVILLMCGCSQRNSSITKPPRAEKGLMDLTGIDLNKNTIVNLDGEWEFYWQKLLTPTDFLLDSNSSNETINITIPSSWNDYEIDGKKLTGQGIGTYRLKIKVPPEQKLMAVKINTISSSFKLWVNGVEVASAGNVGATPQEVIHNFHPGSYFFDLNGETTAKLIINVANFSYKKGGIWESIQFGSGNAIKSERESKVALDLFVIGALVIISLYYLSFYLVRRKEKAMLYFGLSCLLIAIRTLDVGTNYIVEIAPLLNWELVRKIEFSSFYLVTLSLAFFFQYLFPDETPKIQAKIVSVMAGLFFLQACVLPLKIYSDTNTIYLLFTVILVFATTIELVISAIKKREGAIASLLGCSVFYITSINDMLNASQIIHTGNYASLGLIIFVLTQAIILSRRMTIAFNRVEELSQKTEHALDKVNRTLEAVSRSGKSINEMVEGLSEKSMSLMELSNRVATAMDEHANGIENETKSIQDSVKSLNRLVNEIGSVSQKSNAMAEISLSAKAVSEDGSLKMNEMLESVRDIKNLAGIMLELMNKVRASGENSSQMLEMIKHISQNTKMLSFNATVEAAKANEYGKGFAVIAHNIRDLSNSSERFAHDINKSLEEIQNSIQDAAEATLQCELLTKKGEEVANKALSSFKGIEDYVRKINEESDLVNKNSENVSGLANSVLFEFTNIAGVVEETNASVEEVAASTQIQLDYIKKSYEALENIKDQVRQLNQDIN